MPEQSETTFEELVEQFLGLPLAEPMTGTVSMSGLTPETQAFIKRALGLMQRASYSAANFNLALLRWLFVTVPSILPSAWGGRIPPLTLPSRHKKLDAYVTVQNRTIGEEPPIFLDIGCGFPPVTSADTAQMLSDWHIYGIDYAFDDYVLYDPDGHYACFDEKGRFQYFQALMNLSGRALYADPQGTRRQFITLFEDLLPLLPNVNTNQSTTVEKDGKRLIHNHIKDFEKDNLTLIKADMSTLQLPPAKVIRCMNVFIYFDIETRQKMLRQAGKLLDDGGSIIVGTNGLGIQSRYAVYRKSPEGLVMDEFAFGLENVGHIVFMPFFTIHANDPEALQLAELTGTIRADTAFWSDFSARQDELLGQHGICQRNPDGYLYASQDEIAPAEYLKMHHAIWRQLQAEGFLNGAVDVLGRAGYDAWQNSVGDIAIRPVADIY